MKRFVKTFHISLNKLDNEINETARKRSLTIISVSIMSDGRGNVIASVVFEKGGEG